jgi:hypothetical protein
VYADFGYHKLNDKWIDPDDAVGVNPHLDNATAPKEETDKYTPLFPAAHSGPRLLTIESEESLYDHLTRELSDDEGDPRNHRVDLPTFARFAQGAKKGDIFEERELDPTVGQEPCFSLF